MSQPSFILVRPQMGENIGAAARAMWNFGLDRMALVAPREQEAWWQDALEQGLEVAPLVASWELLPFEGDMPLVPWEDLAAMLGAACKEIA